MFPYRYDAAIRNQHHLLQQHLCRRGGAIYNRSNDTVDLVNAILWANRSDSGSGHHIYNYADATMLVSHSDVEGAGFDGSAEHNYNIDADPLFVDTTPGSVDLHLQPGSPCANSGSNDALPRDIRDVDDDGNVQETIPFDKDGNDRIQKPPSEFFHILEDQKEVFPEANLTETGQVSQLDKLWLLLWPF